MRRSQAPSIRKDPKSASGVLDILNSDENHVKALINTPVCKRSFPSEGNGPKESSDTIIYQVVYDQQSTKKHKTFAYDGSLQIRNGKGVLKDESGKFLCSTNVNTEKLESGSRLLIGSFECELVEIQNKRKSPEKVIQSSAKRQKFYQPKSFAATLNPVAENLDSKAQPFESEGGIPKENSDTIIYQVVYGQQSTKKHKTFAYDGSLQIRNGKAVLKDENGKFLSSTNVKIENLQSRLLIGSFECELVDVQNERKSPEKVIQSSAMHQKVYQSKSSSVATSKPVVRLPKKQVIISPAASASVDDEFAVVLPHPPEEHQRRYNISKVPIKEVKVCTNLAKQLRPHQRIAISFMYECVMGFRNVKPTDENFGCLLADEMGLGKTLSTISLLYTLLKQGPYGLNIAKRILIVTPSSLVENWDKEITKWLYQERVFTYIVDGKETVKKFVQSPHVPILLISYEMFINQFKALSSINFDVLVCDEAHRLKNQGKSTTLLSQLECKRRILLTGTPIQNDLQEFHSLIDFANPGLLGTYQEFRRHFEIPIVQSQQLGILPQVQEIGEQRAKELNDITTAVVLRRTQEFLNQYLPNKQELVIFVRPSPLQQTILKKALEFYENRSDVMDNQNFTPLQMIMLLKKICNHPSLIRKTEVKESQLDMMTKTLCQALPSWSEMGPDDSAKLNLVRHILNKAVKRGEKTVLVSYFTKSLDILHGLCSFMNLTVCRLDGSTPTSDRSKIVSAYNDPESNINVFLLSAKAGGVGLNLIGASRLVLFDNDWNPSTDLQAMSRIWRDGQRNQCYIYRLILSGTIEEKIFQRQMFKTSLSGCVVDLNMKSMKLSDAELKDIFSMDENIQKCQTHEMLDCECLEDGSVPEVGESHSPKRPFGKKVKASLQMHELNKWEHHSGENLQEELLNELCLEEAGEDIIFMFRSQTDKTKVPDNQQTGSISSQI